MSQNGYTPGDMADQGAKQFDAGVAFGTAFASLAILIADRAARSDIEIYALPVAVDSLQFFDTRYPQVGSGDPDEVLQYIHQALDYIEARGDAWEWRMQRHADLPHLVRFVEKE